MGKPREPSKVTEWKIAGYSEKEIADMLAKARSKEMYEEIRNTLKECYQPCEENWPTWIKKKRIYERSAIIEIMKEISMNKKKDPVDVIMDFIDKMAECEEFGTEQGYMYLTCRHTAEEMLYWLCHYIV